MNRRLLIIALVVAGALIALAVGWYLISPLFINQTVSEDLPTSLPAPAVSVVPAQAADAMVKAPAEPTHTRDEPRPTEGASATALYEGRFYPLIHDGRGRAVIYQLADGSRILRFEDFEVLNGPELHVYLAPIDPVPSTAGEEIRGSFDLGRLKGNIGPQNYNLPNDLDLSRFKSVVIWCQPFRVPFIAARLAAP